MSTEHEGRIITFYSYKGGVGRTMAVANVAFLAAANGYKVLVMDWDLEAPGLYYHFRSLVDPPEARVLKEAPGVLDLFWDWSSAVAAAQTDSDVETALKPFEDGSVFERCVRNILAWDQGRLDFINAGSPQIQTPELLPYEDALAHFPWPTFFEYQAGGSLIEDLRAWAKREYDFILLDSRTGMADVAGICTMQVPDIVALCFILNRQNIDGIAKVSAAIRNRRQEEIVLHAVPMRMAASDTGEEADARARGIHELTRVGGFSAESVQEDFRLLSVRSAQNVPYYETVAPIVATDISTDPLVLNYIRVATRLLAVPLDIPELSPDWVEGIKRRLQPKNATTEYVRKLKAVDAVRATEELTGLFESALETAVDGGDLSDDYVDALVDAALALTEHVESPVEGTSMLDRAIDLLRALAVENPEKWQTPLAFALERYLDEVPFIFEPEEELSLLEELDGLLVFSTSVSSGIKRIVNRRRAARLFVTTGQMEAAIQTLGEITRLVKELRSGNAKLASDQLEQLVTAEVDVFLQKGIVYEKTRRDPIHQYMQGLKKLEDGGYESLGERGDLRRLAFELHSRIAQSASVEPQIAAQHAVDAARMSSGLPNLASQFLDLANVVIKVPEQKEIAWEFCRNAFEAQERRGRSYFIGYFSRYRKSTPQFFSMVSALASIVMQNAEASAIKTLVAMAETINLILINLRHRPALSDERLEKALTAELVKLASVFKDAKLGEEYTQPLTAHSQWLVRRKRPSK